MAAGLALNVILWPILLLATSAVAAELFGERARILAILVLAPMPLLVATSHTVLQEFPLVTLIVLVILSALRTRLFVRPIASAALGLTLGLGMLTKLSFFTGVMGPLAVVASFALVSRVRAAGIGWRGVLLPIRNIGLAAGIAGALICAWYVPNFAATMAFLKSEFGPNIPGLVSDPLQPLHLGQFAAAQVANMSVLAVLLLIVALGVSLPRLAILRGRGPWATAAFRGLLLATWLLGPIVAVAISTNQDPRYDLAAYPALAVVTGGLLATAPWRIVWPLSLAFTTAVAVSATLQVNVPGYAPPFLPSQITVMDSSLGQLSIPLSGSGGLPGGSMGTLATLEYLESQSRGVHGQIRAETIDILEVNPWINVNNLSYFAAVRHDPFTFWDPTTLDQLNGVPNEQALLSSLESGDYALYVPQPPPVLATNDRVSLLNSPAAADHMTPAIFDLYQEAPHSIPIGPSGGQATLVEVLVRR
jgi:4-amino-4-deoxy-L-arabinose transferase-like glycosyltransferase